MTKNCHGSRTQNFVCASLIVFVLIIGILLPVVLFTRPRLEPIDNAKWKPDCPAEVNERRDNIRIDCHPDPGVTESRCKSRGCCWIPVRVRWPKAMLARAPKCIFPRNYGYIATGKVEPFAHGWQMRLTRQEMPSRYGDDMQTIVVRVEMQTATRLRIRFFDPHEDRFQVPLTPGDKSINGNSNVDPFDGKLYEISYNRNNDTFHLRVRRATNDVTIFDTSLGALIFSDRFLQLTTKLASLNTYGFTGKHFHHLNENHLRLQYAWWTWTMFSSDDAPNERRNSHGVQPMYMCLEDDGNAHAVLFVNSYPMEVQIHPTPAITFRTIGGILDFYIFLGPTPDDVLRQYTEIVGRPFMPPYWGLGLQLLLPNLTDAEQGINAMEFMKNNSLFYESVILDSTNSLSSSSFSALSSYLRKNNERVILTVEPSVPVSNFQDVDITERRLRSKILVNDSTKQQPLYSQTDREIVTFPDFVNSDVSKWWAYKLRNLYHSMQFSGLRLDANEPLTTSNGSVNGCLDDYYNSPPYLPHIKGKTLYENTLCMDSVHTLNGKEVRHIQVHNLYGHMMMNITSQVLPLIFKQKRFLLLSRSTFAGSGQFGGHWMRKFSPTWNHLTWSIPATIEFNLFGIPYVGTSICGDVMTTDSNLCIRWFQTGMFYPFCYISYPFGNENSALKMDNVTMMAKTALNTRITLLPYLYTLFHLAHVNGSAIIRPLFYEFPTDNKTYGVDKQFLFGPALLVSPVLGLSPMRSVYVPRGVWYDFYTRIKITTSGGWDKFDGKLQSVNLHIRGGYIIPTHTSFNYTSRVRKQPMRLIVALDENRRANGTFYFDDGETRDAYKLNEYVISEFNVINDTLTVTGRKGKPKMSNYFSQINFTSVDVLGLHKEPNQVTIGNIYLIPKTQFHWITKSKTLLIHDILIPITDTLQIRWQWKR